MGNGKRTAIYFSMMALGILFIQGCSMVRWHNRMMEYAMECMGMGGHGDHGEEPETQAERLTSIGLCQAAAYLGYQDELGLTSSQMEKLKDLDLHCEKEMSGKEMERKAAEQDYQALLGDLTRNKAERSRLEAKGKEIGELYARMLLIPVDYQEKAMSILTPEQKEQLGTTSAPKPKASQHKH